MSTIYILAKTGYDEFTILGCYLDATLAEQERLRLETLANTYRSDFDLRHERETHLNLYEYEANQTLIEVVVRIRGDGEITETDVRLGTIAQNEQHREPEWWGAATTPEEALANAQAKRLKDLGDE